MTPTDDQLLRAARERCGGHCAYCDVHSGDDLDLGFHQPLPRGGARDEDNALCVCRYCGAHKADYWHETDAPHVPLLHPLRTNMAEHLRWLADGTLAGITREGAFYVQRLGLNRAPLVEARLRLLQRITRRDDASAA